MIEPFDADDHATPLTAEERDELIPTHITLRSELNELEQQNIGTADRWAFSRRHVVLRERFLRSLHRRMFNQVWRWAGKYRTTERNLGVKTYQIEPELHQALDDARLNTVPMRRTNWLSDFIIDWSSCIPFHTVTAAGHGWRPMC
jgi:fido (protein-threonine AMPylation protein)